jgi:hypothetical protein
MKLRILMFFFHNERHRWDKSYFCFSGDAIYDMDGDSKVNIFSLIDSLT